jgi:hypothetical protein
MGKLDQLLQVLLGQTLPCNTNAGAIAMNISATYYQKYVCKGRFINSSKTNGSNAACQYTAEPVGCAMDAV